MTGLIILPFFGGSFFLFSVLLVLTVFICWLWYTTWYDFGKEKLVVQCGWQRWDIFYDKIVSVKSTSNPISSPAFSLQRLEIRYAGNNSLLISPVRREEFMRALEEKIAAAKGQVNPTQPSLPSPVKNVSPHH